MRISHWKHYKSVFQTGTVIACYNWAWWASGTGWLVSHSVTYCGAHRRHFTDARVTFTNMKSLLKSDVCENRNYFVDNDDDDDDNENKNTTTRQ